MPYVQRKKSILNAIHSVLLAPFAFLLVGIVTGLPFLILGAILCVWCMWMAGEPWGNLVPTQDQLFMFLGVMALVSLAAIPLAIRDYFSKDGYETVWQHSSELDEFARRIGEHLLNNDLVFVYEWFSEALKAEVSLPQFRQHIKNLHDKLGRWRNIERACEVEGALCRDANALVHIGFEHANSKRSILELHVNHSEETEVVHFAYFDAEEEDW